MSSKTGLLEAAFAEASEKASDTDLTILSRHSDDPFPDEFPRNDLALLSKCLEVYRKNQTVVDAALQGAGAYLATPEGMAHVEALHGSMAGGEPTELGRTISNSILGSEQFEALRSEVKSSGDTAAAGIGLAGNAVYYAGIGLGVEYMFVGDLDVRFWADFEVQYMKGWTAGLSISVWGSTPLNGLIFGACFEFFYSIPGSTFRFPLTGRFMLYWQRSSGTKKYELAGYEVQVGVGRNYTALNIFGAGAFVGYQLAKNRQRRVKLEVINADTDTNVVTVGTSTTLDVTIIVQADLSFENGSQLSLNMPNFYSGDNVSAMQAKNTPSYWDAPTTDGTKLIFTANQQYSWTAGDEISFQLESASADGYADQTRTVPGNVELKGDPTTKLPITAHSTLYCQLQEYSASITTWTATAGTATDHLTLQGDCAGQDSCSGGPVTVYVQGGNTASSLVPATDPDGNEWELGYQFNYEDGTPSIRAVIYDPDVSPLFIKWTGNWIQYSVGGTGKSTATYQDIDNDTEMYFEVTFLSND